MNNRLVNEIVTGVVDAQNSGASAWDIHQMMEGIWAQVRQKEEVPYDSEVMQTIIGSIAAVRGDV